MPKKPSREDFSETETQRRVETALRAAFKTPPQPMKDIPRKRPKTKRKTKRTAK